MHIFVVPKSITEKFNKLLHQPMLPHGQKIICFLQGKRIDDHSLGMTTLLLFLGYGHVHANQNIKSFSGSCSRIALHVWHSFTNSFLSCCELFFCQTFFLKIAHGVKLLFYALKEEWREVKLKKSSFSQLSHLFSSLNHS